MNPCLSLCLEGEWAVSDSPQRGARAIEKLNRLRSTMAVNVLMKEVQESHSVTNPVTTASMYFM